MNKFQLSDHLPLIAIIRGVKPDNVIRVASILNEEGFSMIEVPLNSPDALESIHRLVMHFDLNTMLIGAGTVTTPELAQAVIDTGANLIVTPNYNQQVIELAIKNGCATFPGVVTPTEAFNAIAAGATGLKIFPISALGLDGFKALQSVLPQGINCMPVGGINPTIESMKPYTDVNAAGFGLGSSLFTPSMSDSDIRKNARKFALAYKKCIENS